MKNIIRVPLEQKRKNWQAIKHDKWKTVEYKTWQRIKDRCYNSNNKSFKNYGGKGIKVCNRWLNSFPNFFKDMGKRPDNKSSIDRINSKGNYTKSNCRWADWFEQENNRSINKPISYKGITLNKSQWAKKIGIRNDTLHCRLKKGWQLERALTNQQRKTYATK